MIKRKLLIAAALVVTAASTTFAGWTGEKTVNHVGLSNDSKTLTVTLKGNSTVWHNGSHKARYYYIVNNSFISDTQFKMQHEQLLTAVESGKPVNIGASGTKEDLWGNPAYKINTIHLHN